MLPDVDLMVTAHRTGYEQSFLVKSRAGLAREARLSLGSMYRKESLVSGSFENGSTPAPGGLQFSGLAPWRPDTEIIECQVGDRVIDLHNECTLLEIAVRCAPLLELDLRLLFDPEQRALSLTFSDVRQLVFTQDSDVAGADWSPRDVETFYALDFGFDSSGSAAIAVRTIIGDLRFSCSAVKLQLT